MTAWNCPLQALTDAGMRVKFVSKVCKRLTRWTNYTLLGSSFFGGQDLNQGARYQKRWTHFRECLSKKPMVFPNCQTVYKSKFGINVWIKKGPPIFSIRKRGARFFFRNLWNLPVSTKKKMEWKRVPLFSKSGILFRGFPSYYNLQSLRRLPSLKKHVFQGENYYTYKKMYHIIIMLCSLHFSTKSNSWGTWFLEPVPVTGMMPNLLPASGTRACETLGRQPRSKSTCAVNTLSTWKF